LIELTVIVSAASKGTGEQIKPDFTRHQPTLQYMPFAFVISLSMALRVWLWMNQGVLCISEIFED
jgi:hypothetical protein